MNASIAPAGIESRVGVELQAIPRAPQSHRQVLKEEMGARSDLGIDASIAPAGIESVLANSTKLFGGQPQSHRQVLKGARITETCSDTACLNRTGRY